MNFNLKNPVIQNMQETSPYFSICVATRNRPETLLYCLKTLLHQDFQDYEIIVSDNCDEKESIETVKIIAALNADKIKYFKPGAVVSMTENYEFALSKTKGKYILCMGDDDGLIADSLQYVYDFIQEYGAKVIKCPEAAYMWMGSYSHPNSALFYPFERPVTEVKSKSILQKVANFELRYSNLPMIYYSFVSSDIINDVVKEKGSFFQNSGAIDVYSGFVIAYKTESYFITDKPFVIIGSSGKSTGGTVTLKPKSKIATEYHAQHGTQEVYNKYQLPMLPKIHIGVFVWVELLKFMENYTLDKTFLNIEYRNLFIDMVSQEPVFDNKKDLGFVKYFSGYTCYEKDIQYITDNFLGKKVFFPNFRNIDRLIYEHELINPGLFHVKDVYGASLLCRNLLNSKKDLKPISISGNDLKSHKRWMLQEMIRRVKNFVLG